MTAAAIDIGTNSVKLAVGRVGCGGGVEMIHESVEITRLGEGIDATDAMGSEGIERTMAVIGQMTDKARSLGAREVRVVGTAAVREAVNRRAFAELLDVELGVGLEVLSEEDECRLSYMAVALDRGLGGYDGERAVVDSGGGSTEFAFGTGGHLASCVSVGVGAVRLHERFLTHDPPVHSRTVEAIWHAEQLIRGAVGSPVCDSLVAVGGSAVNVARMVRKAGVERTSEVHGAVISENELSELIRSLAQMKVEERRSLVGLDPERADIILAGAIILDRVLEVLGVTEMTVSTRGLRHGVLYEMLMEEKAGC